MADRTTRMSRLMNRFGTLSEQLKGSDTLTPRQLLPLQEDDMEPTEGPGETENDGDEDDDEQEQTPEHPVSRYVGVPFWSYALLGPQCVDPTKTDPSCEAARELRKTADAT